MMEQNDRGSTKTNDPLSRLYRVILTDTGVTHEKYQEWITTWLNDSKNNIENNIKTRSTERGNIMQEITRPNMTMKVFLKRLRIMPIVRFRFIAELEWKSGKVTQHSTSVKLNEEIEDDPAESKPG